MVLQELNSEIVDKIVDPLFDFQLQYDTNISSVIYSEKVNARVVNNKEGNVTGERKIKETRLKIKK